MTRSSKENGGAQRLLTPQPAPGSVGKGYRPGPPVVVGRPAPPQDQRPRTQVSPVTIASVTKDADREASAYARSGKRAFEVALIVLAAPLVLLLALPIVLLNLVLFADPRRILFVQPRVGRAGTTFLILKFRTMRPARRGAFDSWQTGGDGLRVTGFGRFLRNTHLDELPQLVNVLRGDMALIGPRPEMIEIHRWACERIPAFPERNALRPGLTGLSQITQGYAGMDLGAYRRKLAVDRLYHRRISLALDLFVLARTVVWVLSGHGWRWRHEIRPHRPVVQRGADPHRAPEPGSPVAERSTPPPTSRRSRAL